MSQSTNYFMRKTENKVQKTNEKLFVTLSHKSQPKLSYALNLNRKIHWIFRTHNYTRQVLVVEIYYCFLSVVFSAVAPIKAFVFSLRQCHFHFEFLLSPEHKSNWMLCVPLPNAMDSFPFRCYHLVRCDIHTWPFRFVSA